MHALHLDFLHPTAAAPRLGLALLLVGLVVAGAVGWRYVTLDREATRLEARIADTQRMARRDFAVVPVAAGDPKVVAQELGQANTILASLAVPWDALFRSLETAGGNSVGLVGIQPDGSGRQVRISGEARRFEDLVAYLKRLEATDGFSNVFLAAHEMKGESKGNSRTRSIGFTLHADWSARQ